MSVIKLIIPNFDVYNPRDDVKRSTWVRLQKNWWADSALFRASLEAKVIWFYLLSVGSAEEVCIDPLFAARVLSIDEKKAVDSIFQLDELGLVKILNHSIAVPRTYVDERARENTCATNGRTNETDETNERSLPARASPACVPEPAPALAHMMPDGCTESDLAVASEWLEFSFQSMPWRRTAVTAGWTVAAFAEAIAKVKRVTGLNDSGVAAIFEFIRGDDFWSKNALSPASLLKKSARNDQRKIDNILIRMKAGTTKQDRDKNSLARWAEGD